MKNIESVIVSGERKTLLAIVSKCWSIKEALAVSQLTKNDNWIKISMPGLKSIAWHKTVKTRLQANAEICSYLKSFWTLPRRMGAIEVECN